MLERYGRNGGEECGVPQNGLHGLLFISTVDLLSLHGLPSTSSGLHGLLFIQPPPRATPPATVQPPLHRLLFIQPSTVYSSSSPPHHGVLFNHPSTATPPPSTVHPALHTTGSCSSRGNATAQFSSNPPPPRNAHCSSNRSASVSSSSEGIAPSGSVNSH